MQREITGEVSVICTDVAGGIEMAEQRWMTGGKDGSFFGVVPPGGSHGGVKERFSVLYFIVSGVSIN